MDSLIKIPKIRKIVVPICKSKGYSTSNSDIGHIVNMPRGRNAHSKDYGY